MKVRDLEIESEIAEVFETQGIVELYPPQEESVGPALKGENLVLAMPTASGKSLVAYLAVLRSVLDGGKALYIVPLRALASEKYEDFIQFEKVGVRVGISVGDYDAPDPTLEMYDVIIATSEKADSLIRHRMHWLSELSVVVADEIHLMGDPDRGPTLEVTLSKLKQINPKAQIVALSATIKNSDEIASWLKAKHIRSEWRPVPLKEGIYYEGSVRFADGSHKSIRVEGDDISSLVKDVVMGGGQSLIFVNTRRSTEALSRTIGMCLNDLTKSKEKRGLEALAGRLLRRQEEPTSIGARLARRIRNGVAFHHAGLSNDQRKIVEKNFKSGLLKCIVATPTLAAGINLPARRVIVRDLRRFDSTLGSIPIPVMEIKQMSGRAGRPQYDKEGEAILMAKKEGDLSFIMENYILNEPERIESKLGSLPALRMHILASIATRHVKTEEELYDFIESTFFAHQSDVWSLNERIEDVLLFLEKEEFIKREPRLIPTLFGKRTSDLYIDPLSAVILRKALSCKGDDTFAFLHAICATPDMPTLYLRRGDYEWVEDLAYSHDYLLDYEDYDFFLAEVKTAALVGDWIEEVPANSIVKRFNVGPGDIHRWVEMAEWLMYSMKELARIFDKPRVKLLSDLIPRIHYGVKEELLELVSLRGIGRVRARALYSSGYKGRTELRRAGIADLAKIRGIGGRIARNIKRELGEKISTDFRENRDSEEQSILADFKERS